MNNSPEPIQKEIMAFMSNLWGLVLLKGVILILLGILLFSWPMATLKLITIFLGAFFLADGVIDIVMSILAIAQRPWVMQFIKGLLQIIIGLIVLKYTGLAITTLFIWLGILFIISGLSQIIGTNKKIIGKSNRTLEIIGGILTLIVGIMMLFKPTLTGLAFIWIIGIYAIIVGIFIIISSLSIRHEIKKHTQRA